jgi:5-methylthioadenosine/S-adenosylhomocysteine deaminase
MALSVLKKDKICDNAPLSKKVSDMRQVDTLIVAGWVIPVEPEGLVLKQHAVAIQNGQIVGILPSDEATQQFSAQYTHHLPHHVLIPGLINAHTHAAMTLLRGFADDLPLMEWLQNHIWPAEQKWVNPEFVADGTRLAIAEMIQSGVTCFNDMYFFPDVTANVAADMGMRSCIGLIIIDFPSAWAKDSAEYFLKADRLYQHYQGHPLVRTAFAPHAPYSVCEKSLKEVVKRAEINQIPIHIHLHETAFEVEQYQQKHQLSPLDHLDQLGMVSEKLLAVHATQLTQQNQELIKKRGANIIHCPESNLKLASGFCPVNELLNLEINIALGTDGAASNDDLDMLGEMKTAALLAKGVSGNPAALPAAKALTMATLNGAKALQIQEVTGSLKIGKSADIVAIDMQHFATQPLYNPLTQLVYSSSRAQITDVWIAGKQLLKSRLLISLDILELQAKIKHWASKISS